MYLCALGIWLQSMCDGPGCGDVGRTGTVSQCFPNTTLGDMFWDEVDRSDEVGCEDVWTSEISLTFTRFSGIRFSYLFSSFSLFLTDDASVSEVEQVLLRFLSTSFSTPLNDGSGPGFGEGVSVCFGKKFVPIFFINSSNFNSSSSSISSISALLIFLITAFWKEKNYIDYNRLRLTNKREYIFRIIVTILRICRIYYF